MQINYHFEDLGLYCIFIHEIELLTLSLLYNECAIYNYKTDERESPQEA